MYSYSEEGGQKKHLSINSSNNIKGDCLPEEKDPDIPEIILEEDGTVKFKAKRIKTPAGKTVEYIDAGDLPSIFIGGLKNYWKNTDILGKIALVIAFFGWIAVFSVVAIVKKIAPPEWFYYNRFPESEIVIVLSVIWVFAIIWVAVVGDRLSNKS